MSDDLKDMLKEVPWTLKILWALMMVLGFSFAGLIVWLLVVLIKHFS